MERDKKWLLDGRHYASGAIAEEQTIKPGRENIW
jgi:hypothetical protein